MRKESATSGRWRGRGVFCVQCLILACGCALFVVAAVSLLPSAGLAQQGEEPVRVLAAEDPNYPDLDVRAAAREAESRFRLFGSQDIAFSSWRGTGTQWGKLTNEGPLGMYNTARTLLMRNTEYGTAQHYFEVPMWAGAPPSEWERAKQLVPELERVKGGGYVSEWNGELIRPPGGSAWYPVDGALGAYHSGVVSTHDGACTDHDEGFAPDLTVPLMATSDCEATWGTESERMFARHIPLDNWVTHFDSLADKSRFSWDFWRQPETSYTEDFIGEFQTFGVFSDWTAERLARFGDAMPAISRTGSGEPGPEGFPLGLTVKFDAYTFGLPTVENAFYWRALVINESERVYGVGLDYDSLYIGLIPEPLLSSDAGYYRPDLGGLLITANGVHPNCNNAIILDGVSGCGTTGFECGANSLVIFKSPIGDLRNKLFTRRPNGAPCEEGVDPFCDPAHPSAGDTITFNHGHMCGYGSCYNIHHDRSARAGFGMHASRPTDVLDGRDPFTDMSNRDYWRTFRPWDWPARNVRFNRYMPPEGWMYSNRPAGAGLGPDTLYLDSCVGGVEEFPAAGGCVEAWSDTLPGRINNSYMNVSVLGIGPFPLGPGDTTAFLLGFVGGPDSVSTEGYIRNAMRFYLNSYFAAKPPPPVRIVSVETDPGDRGREGGTAVRIFFDDTAEEWVDPFLAKLADDLEGTGLGVDNPWLVDSIRARAADNIAALHIYKSCDLGSTFTATGTCRAAPLVDERGNPIKLGWQTYATLRPDDDGSFPNLFVDEEVTAGLEYVYTIVAETRGAKYWVFMDADESPREVEFAPVFLNPLSVEAADPNVARVYVPARRQAGAEDAEVVWPEDDRLTPVEFHPLEVVLARELEEAAAYRVGFGDSVLVRSWADTSRVEVYQIVPGLVITPPDTAVEDVVVGAETYVDGSGAGVSLAGGRTSLVGDTTITVFRWLTLVVLDASDGRPLLVSDILDGTSTTPGRFLSRADFPGWLINVEQGLEGDRHADRYLYLGDDPPDTLPELGEPTLEWRNGVATGEMYGKYRVIFGDAEYGPERMFRIDPYDPQAMREALASSLEARAVVSMTQADMATAARVSDALGSPVALEDLRVVDLPFRVVNLTNDAQTDVRLAMLAAAKLDSITLGTGVVTLRAGVPEDKWVAEEPLILIETLRDVPLKGEYDGREYYRRDGSGKLVYGDTTLVTWTEVLLGCAEPATGCNPIRGTETMPGATGHISFRADQALEVEYLNPFTSRTGYVFAIDPVVTGMEVREITEAALAEIKVVPNPYVLWSEFEQSPGGTPRLMFTGLPPRGTISIYTVSGQFVQRIRYDEADLRGAGDLFWDMRTREGLELAAGLYVFVLEGEYDFGPDGQGGMRPAKRFKKLGKFVVIR